MFVDFGNENNYSNNPHIEELRKEIDSLRAAEIENNKPKIYPFNPNWPEGYTYKFGGDAENTAENMGAVINYLPLSGFIIILLLIIMFNSVRKTIMVAATIPLGIIGVVINCIQTT